MAQPELPRLIFTSVFFNPADLLKLNGDHRNICRLVGRLLVQSCTRHVRLHTTEKGNQHCNCKGVSRSDSDIAGRDRMFKCFVLQLVIKHQAIV